MRGGEAHARSTFVIVCAAVALMLAPRQARAEWQVRPYIGFTFAGATNFVDPEGAIDSQNMVIGVSGGWLGEIFGLEGDLGRAPGFFQRDSAPEGLVLTSAVTTLTGNVVIALPRAMAGYGLRPYFSGGAGLLHVAAVGRFIPELHNRTVPAYSLGGGVTGFVSESIGVNWDVRRLSSFRGEGETLGNSLGKEYLSFWRATMAVALRY